MSIVAFDTYKAVKALRSAGFNDSQAEAVTEQIGAAISEGLATTGDIQALESGIQSSRSELKGDIQALEGKIQALEGKIQSLRSELKSDIQALEGKIQGLEGKIQTIESRLTVKLYSALVLAVALIKALDYILPVVK